jgi:predicted secreted protein
MPRINERLRYEPEALGEAESFRRKLDSLTDQDWKALMVALSTNDRAGAAKVFGMTPDEFGAMFKQIKEHARELIQRHPDLLNK